VLLPAYDAERTISACLRSVIRQTFDRWECIVVDDGSSDATPERVHDIAAQDPRVRLIARPHEGLVAALQAGLAECRGAFVARMDADDLMHRSRLAEQCAMLEADESLDAVGCHVRLFPRDGLSDGSRAYERWLNGIDSAECLSREAFVECPVAHPTLMIRRTRLVELGYRDRGWPEDYDLLLRILTAGGRVGVLPRRRLAWRQHEGRLSRTSAVYGLDRFTKCKAAFLARSFLAGGDRYILWGHGGTGRALRRELLALGKSPSYIVEVHPRRLGNRIAGAEVIPIERLPRVPRQPIVVSVAGEAARGQIRAALAEMGFVETRDYVCAA